MSVFEEIVQACYDSDNDPDRTSIRYFAGPESYVELTIQKLLNMRYLGQGDVKDIYKLDEPEPSRPESEKATKLQ